MKCLILLVAILPFCLTNPCNKDEYWSTFSKVCFKCTQCKPNQIVIRSCQPHKDTICSLKVTHINHKQWDKHQDNKNNKKIQHFDKTKLHFISNEDAQQDILDNQLNYPTLNLKIKSNFDDNHHKINNKKKNNDVKKQRINDKFLKWNDDDNDDDDDDDYNYDDYDYNDDNKKHELSKTNKQKEKKKLQDDNDDDDYNNKKHKSIKTNKKNGKQKLHHDDDEFYDYDDDKKHKSTKTNKQKEKHRLHDDDDDEDDDYDYDDDDEEDDDYDDDENDENNLDAILDKHSKTSWNTKLWKDSLIVNKNKKKKLQKNDKNLARLAKLEDEKKLEEWLRQSRKQFKVRKDNLLKTLKEEQMDTYKSDKRIRLNYPLLNLNDKYGDKIKYNTKSSTDKVKADERKHTASIDSEVELFKELIKNEESQEMELATLMSNKKEPSVEHYKTVTPAHRMFLGEPSSDLVKLGRPIKDPQQVIKEEMGDNFIYEKSKFTVLPLMKNEENKHQVMEFSAVERLVWDWQALAVISAGISSILFFLVIGVFLLSNARQSSTDKHHYIADNEELSTRVALIQPALETSAADGNCTSKFLEQYLTNNEDMNKSKINKTVAK